MMSFVVAMLIQAATSPWSPPAQAQWAAEGPGIEARLEADDKPISMFGEATFRVIMKSNDAELQISPFIAVTRGLTFEVVDHNGNLVTPCEPMAISPPAPPLGQSQLRVVTSKSPMNIDIRERTVSMFPKPGLYRMRATISLMNTGKSPATYKNLRTNYVTVKVDS